MSNSKLDVTSCWYCFCCCFCFVVVVVFALENDLLLPTHNYCILPCTILINTKFHTKERNL